MWQQQDDTVVADPFGLARTDELVNDTLGRVVKVSKLGLPEDQSIWTRHGKAKLKTCSDSHDYTEVQNDSVQRSVWPEWLQFYLALHTLIRSCCRQCTEPGCPTGGSWEHRNVCPPLGHGEHDDDGYKTNERQK